MKLIVPLFACVALVSTATPVLAQEAPPNEALPAGRIEIVHPWIMAPPKGTEDVLSVNGYATFRNTGTKTVRIVRASSKQFRWVMIQRATLHDGHSRRTVVGDFTVLPETTVAMSDSGYRFTFLGATRPVTAGSKVEVELEFRDLPPTKLVFPVLAQAPRAAPAR
jgi:copper(I)-binding protein